MEKQNIGNPAGGSTSGQSTDYKSRIIKGIEEIQQIAPNDEIKNIWEGLKQAALKETEDWKLHCMYHCFFEELSKAREEPVQPFKIKTEHGVREFASVEDFIKKT